MALSGRELHVLASMCILPQSYANMLMLMKKEFEANFAELNVDFAEGWELIYQDSKITRQDWPKVIKLAQKASIRLTLQRTCVSVSAAE
jgi:hypothetical protein